MNGVNYIIFAILSMKPDDTKIPKFTQGFMAPTDGKILKNKTKTSIVIEIKPPRVALSVLQSM